MRDAQINYPALARVLRDRLAEVTPAGVELTVAGPTIRLRMAGTPWGMDGDLSYPTEWWLCSVVWNVFDQLQDEIAEIVAEPWPARSPGPMPETFAEVRGDFLVVGWGDPTDPVLQLPPVALSTLG